MISKKNYYISKTPKSSETVYLEIENYDGYEIKPKAKKKDEIEVNKIVFVNPEFSEKIIRKKIDKKILNLLNALKKMDEEGTDEGSIKRSLMDAEKLRIQIINNYVKYLGHTYESLTLKKIQIIINELRFRLFTLKQYEMEESYQEQRESRRGR